MADNDIHQLTKDFNAAIYDGVAKGLTEGAMLIKREAVRNAPRSPTQAQINAARKSRWKAQRNPRATSRPKPGGLERSIQSEVKLSKAVDKSHASIFVDSASEAGKYAKRIHDEKYKTWKNRGLGTISKGAHADDKFIERAVNENLGTFHTIVKKKIYEQLAKRGF